MPLDFFRPFLQLETVVTDHKTPRRRSLLKGAALAAGAMSAPMVATAQTVTSLRFQSTWPSKDIFHEYATDFAKKVNDMTGGCLLYTSPSPRDRTRSRMPSSA